MRHYREDPHRCTGRTKRMLLRAILCFLEGNNVSVGAFNINYSYDLCRQAKEIIHSLRIQDEINLAKRNCIEYHGKTLWFTRFDLTCRWENPIEKRDGNWQRYEDHHYPIPYFPPEPKEEKIDRFIGGDLCQ